MGIGVFLGVIWWLQRRPAEAASLDLPPSRTFAAMSFVGAAAAASHAAYAGVQFSEAHYRTQNYSRIWCSILLALVLAFAARRWPRGRWFAATIAAAFVGFGVEGGMERQEFFVATWSHQRKELVSLVRQARGFGAAKRARARAATDSVDPAGHRSGGPGSILGDDPVSSGVKARGVPLES